MATYLKKKAPDSVEVKIFDCNRTDDLDYMPFLIDYIKENYPDVFGLSMMFDNSYTHIPGIVSTIREHSRDSLIVIGGSASSTAYEEVLNDNPEINGLCYMEGEIPILGLLTSDDMGRCMEESPYWVTRSSMLAGKVIKKEVLPNLDDVIDLDYSMIDVDMYELIESFSPFAMKLGQKKRQFFLITSRGCPFKCTFCVNSAHNDKSMRYASVDLVIGHVKKLVDEYGMNVLTLYDDQLLFNKPRAKEIFRRLAQFNIRVALSSGVSVAFIDEEMAQLMRSAGVDTANLAIESGDPYVLKELMHKPLTLSKVKEVVGILKRNNIWAHGYFVTGIPGETDEHRSNTIRFIKETGLDWSGFNFATPTVGSLLYKTCVDNGYIRNDIKIGDLDTRYYIIKTPDYSPEHIVKATYLMNLDVNFVSNSRMSIGDYQVAADCFRVVISQYPRHAFAHYYLSKCLDKPKEAAYEYNLAVECTKENPDWREYFNHFNIKDI